MCGGAHLFYFYCLSLLYNKLSTTLGRWSAIDLILEAFVYHSVINLMQDLKIPDNIIQWIGLPVAIGFMLFAKHARENWWK